jgi:hypothetical protein
VAHAVAGIEMADSGSRYRQKRSPKLALMCSGRALGISNMSALVSSRVLEGRGAIGLLVATKPVDFCKGAEGLAAPVREQMRADPFSGPGLCVPSQTS